MIYSSAASVREQTLGHPPPIWGHYVRCLKAVGHGRTNHDADDRGGLDGGYCDGGGGVVVAVAVAVVTVVVVATVPVEVGLSRARGLRISRALRCNKAPFFGGFRYTTVLTSSLWQRYTSHQSPLFHGVSLHGMTWSKHDRYRRRKARWCWRLPSAGGAR